MDGFVDGLNEALRASLAPKGFAVVRGCRWVGSVPGPVRSIFEFQSLKGATYSARWGFSLDFVPLLRGAHLRAKRTPETAEFDLCIDPVDELGSPPDWCSVKCSSESLASEGRELLCLATKSADAAHRDFSRVTSVHDLMAVFQERARMSFRRFSLENYKQTHLAWGLGLVGAGKPEEGRAHIALFCERYEVDPNDSVLRRAEDEASQYAATHSLCRD
jgi:hypothetical protein